MNILYLTKKVNILFDTLNTFYLRLYVIGYTVKDHSVKQETCCHHYMGYSFWLAVRDLLYAPSNDPSHHGATSRTSLFNKIINTFELNVDYKIASSVIASRMKLVLPNVISESQAGFLKGRFIGETTRIIYDVLDYCKTNNIPGLLLTIDFEKAFDTIDWDFIDKTVQSFNFWQLSGLNSFLMTTLVPT